MSKQQSNVFAQDDDFRSIGDGRRALLSRFDVSGHGFSSATDEVLGCRPSFDYLRMLDVSKLT
jgi:hypothetical protein